jgi:hypothetical protein
MSEQEDMDAMLRSIGQAFGPMVKYIQFDDGSSFALPEWECRKGPLTGYGDTISVGDWAWVTQHRREGGKVSRHTEPFPQQIIYISPETPPSIAFAVRDGGCPFFNARLMGDWRWLTFRKVAVEDVPLYLREPLPLPVGVTRAVLRQLTRQELLTKFVNQSEVICYTAAVNLHQQPGLVVRHEMMPLLLEWEQQPGKRRLFLKSLRPKYPYVNGDFERWSASERQIAANGTISVKQRMYSLCLYDVDGSGPLLLRDLEHWQSPTKEDL